MINKTIAAIATPLGPGGIGIIRISGPEALKILKKVFIPQRRRAGKAATSPSEIFFNTHQVYYGHIVDSVERNYIDEVLAICMRGPKSFTREDVVEIHSHSGFVVLDRILSTVFDAGAILAQPGEFTKRAFLNGRIDLTQAEAVIDLINAPCETALKMASQQIAGDFRKVIEGLIFKIRSLQARCEAIIEFDESDQLEQNYPIKEIHQAVRQSVLPEIDALIKQQSDNAIFREGIVLAITGIPNVGKSSLLNRLVQNETAIVSEVPGTTRDILKEYISINGIPVVVCDSAGIHESKDPVECLGIDKARKQVGNADIVLLVIEAVQGMDRCDEEILACCDPEKTIIVINKEDIGKDTIMQNIERQAEKFQSIRVSAKFGNGIEQLKDLIFKKITIDRKLRPEERVTPNLRQRKLLQRARQELLNGLSDEALESAWELVGETFNQVVSTLDEIGGRRNKEELYDHIFSRFCVGK